MREIASRTSRSRRCIYPKDEAVRLFESLGQTLKVELIREKGGDTVSCYAQGEFVDFCLGPHVPVDRLYPALQAPLRLRRLLEGRREGPAAPADLRDRLLRQEAARRLPPPSRGSQEEGPPQAGRRARPLQLLRRPRRRPHPLAPQGRPDPGGHRAALAGAALGGGYDILYTPHIGRANLWQTSGHLDFYKDEMYSPMDIDGAELLPQADELPVPHPDLQDQAPLLPRPAPALGRAGHRLPLRAESASSTACSASAASPRTTPTSSARPEQIDAEILRVLDFFDQHPGRFRVHRHQDRALGPGSGQPRQVLRVATTGGGRPRPRSSRPSKPASCPTSAWRARPSSTARRSTSRSRTPSDGFWQCTTIQFDFNMSERFDMTYIGEDNQAHRPYMVHRALLGSLERFFGILDRALQGEFPALAGPGPGRRPAHRRPARGVCRGPR